LGNIDEKRKILKKVLQKDNSFWWLIIESLHLVFSDNIPSKLTRKKSYNADTNFIINAVLQKENHWDSKKGNSLNENYGFLDNNIDNLSITDIMHIIFYLKLFFTIIEVSIFV
jgi:hypothetical protein